MYYLKNLHWLIATVVVTALFLLPVFSGEYASMITGFMEAYPASAPFVIILFRFLGVVLAPLPGAPVSFASIALLPWREAWIYNFIGMELGAVCAFFIARKFREPVVARLAPLGKIHEWQDKIPHRKQFFIFVLFRLTSILAFDFVTYAAGLSKLPFRLFFAASLLIDIPLSFLYFFLGGIAIRYSVYMLVAFFILFFCSIFFWKRYARDILPSKLL